MTQHHHEEEHDDDIPVGRLLTRREALVLLGGSGAAIIASLGLPQLVSAQSTTPTATALPSCVVVPELTEGPYFVANELNRFDIRFDPTDETIIKEGLPFLLRYRVTDVSDGTCVPLEGAQVDIWHCDALGEYSGVQDAGFDTSDQLWLRGYQLTDELGVAEFMTIVPGWYSGRAIHIHFKIRTEDGWEFTSQLFFDPEQIEELYTNAPYSQKGLPDTPNSTDNIFQGSEGLLTLTLEALDEDVLTELADRDVEITSGYVATFDVGLDLSDASVGASDSAGGGAGGGRGGRGRP